MEDYFRLLKVALDEARMLRYEMANKERASQLSEWARTGNLGNGRLPLYLCSIYTENLRSLAKDYAQKCIEIYDSFDFSLGEEPRAKIIQFCVAALNVSKASFEEALFQGAPFNNNGFRHQSTSEQFREVASLELQTQLATCITTMCNDIEIKLRKINMDKAKGSAVTINVAGNVGQMQVGDHNNMTITQDNRMAFSNAFNQIREALKDALPAQEFTQLNEVITECEVELNKEKPNSMRLTGLLAAIGGVVKGLPQLVEGYEALKTLSALFGVKLP